MRQSFLLLIIAVLSCVNAYAADVEEKIVIDTASAKVDIILNESSNEYRSYYNGTVREFGRDCSFIAVQNIWLSAATITNYKVCDGIVIRAEDALNETLPPEINTIARQVAKMAQHFSFASESHMGFTVVGKSLKSVDTCTVEVKTIKNGRLYQVQRINGCLL